MNDMPRFTGWTLAILLLILLGAGGARVWYVETCADSGKGDPALLVQGNWPTADKLIANNSEQQWYGCQAPLAQNEERTAHVAPGFPMLLAVVTWCSDSPDRAMRWLQCVLGSLTAACYFLFARSAFHSTPIATVAGLLCACYPFWIINTAEINDGVLVSFLVAVSLAIGARAGQTGGAFTALVFGIALAGVAMTRATLLPFALVGLLWFLWECRRFPLGFFIGFLALIGFINGLGPWAIRNYQAFERPIPVANSTYLHLWIGNHPHATGSTLDEQALRATLTEQRRQALLDEPDQTTRYNQLSVEVLEEVREHPVETLARRINAALVYVLGERWFKQRQLGHLRDRGDAIAEAPEWVRDHAGVILHATLIGMIILAFFGWRWSYPWHRHACIGTIALIFLPLPYVLSHAEPLSGPRLPLDGVLLCYAAFALVSFIPGAIQLPKASPKSKRDQEA